MQALQHPPVLLYTGNQHCLNAEKLAYEQTLHVHNRVDTLSTGLLPFNHNALCKSACYTSAVGGPEIMHAFDEQ